MAAEVVFVAVTSLVIVESVAVVASVVSVKSVGVFDVTLVFVEVIVAVDVVVLVLLGVVFVTAICVVVFVVSAVSVVAVVLLCTGSTHFAWQTIFPSGGSVVIFAQHLRDPGQSASWRQKGSGILPSIKGEVQCFTNILRLNGKCKES